VKPGVVFVLALLLALPALGADLLVEASQDAELAPLAARLSDRQIEKIASWTFESGRGFGKDVVLVRTEGDPLNAVAAATLAIRHYRPRLIVTFGTARPHDPKLAAGDVVVARDFTIFAGFNSKPRGAGEGIHPLDWDPDPTLVMHPEEQQLPTRAFATDAKARELMLALPWPGGHVRSGTLGSSPEINREADRISWLRQNWGTDCEDRESAYIAGCASLLNVPVAGFRIIGDDESAASDLALRFLEAWK
jgi:adenosylhomocysteine nucleosidase